MDNDKPFKTIEVLDSRTSQVCKIACMSCIRGHRTTACGIPVCRTKLFWTVKRPGRPANACSCRYGGKGGCKCVVVKSSCPHKATKGAKRTGECRCDEQGRYCCLLQPQDWAMLLSLQKPTVDFFSSREDLEDSHVSPTAMSLPATPAFSGDNPRAYGDRSVSSTPGLPDSTQPMRMMSGQFSSLQSPLRQLTPRFDTMSVESPRGSEQLANPERTSWITQTPLVPQDVHPLQYQSTQQPEEVSICCKGASSPLPMQRHEPYMALGQLAPSSMPHSTFEPFADFLPTASAFEQPLQQAAYNKFNNDYFAYQFPSAMCQTCGLSGCTCRNCPPVMQNTENGSWAQMCGRKHARTATYAAPTALHAYSPLRTLPQQQPVQFTFPQPSQQEHPISHTPFSYQLPPEPRFGDLPPPNFNLTPEPYPQRHPSDLHSPQLLDDFRPFDPGDRFGLPGGARDIDISELLMEDLEQPEVDCCCGGNR